MIILPPRDNRILKQTNRSSVLGSLWSTRNIDLQSNVGVVRLANKMKLNASSADDADMGKPIAFAQFDARVWAMCGSRIFKNAANNLISAISTEDTSTGYSTDYDVDESDMLVFNNALVTSRDNQILSKAADGSGTGAWTSRTTSLTAGEYHKLLNFKRHNKLYIADATTIRSMDTSWSLASSGNDYALTTWTADFGEVVTMVQTSTSIFIGLLRPSNVSQAVNGHKGGRIWEWDGVSQTITREYEISALGALAGCVINDVPYFVDSDGKILKYSGYSFNEVATLPLDRDMLINATVSSNTRFIYPNGMVASPNGTVQILINNLKGDNGGTIHENVSSGIWEWSEETGLVHKHSLSYMPLASSSLTDYGQNRISSAGALANANLYSNSSSGRATLICGATYYTDATTTANGIFVDAPTPVDNATTFEGKKAGYFVTPWLLSNEIKDVWKKVFVKFREMLNSTDLIVVKGRTRERTPLELTATWTSTTSFLTSTDLSDYAVGDEVEVLQGTGSGMCSHITEISEDGGDFTVVVDSVHTGATGTAIFRLQKWEKILSVSNQTDESSIQSWGKTSERVQLKCYMEFTGDNELFELGIINGTHQKAE